MGLTPWSNLSLKEHGLMCACCFWSSHCGFLCLCVSTGVSETIITETCVKVMSSLMAKLSCREAYILLSLIFLHSVGYILLILNKSTRHQESQPKDKQTKMMEKLWKGEGFCNAGQALLWNKHVPLMQLGLGRASEGRTHPCVEISDLREGNQTPHCKQSTVLARLS